MSQIQNKTKQNSLVLSLIGHMDFIFSCIFHLLGLPAPILGLPAPVSSHVAEDTQVLLL